MKKSDFKVGAKFLIDKYKVPATITWKSELSNDFSAKTPMYCEVNFQLTKTGIQLYTCFGTEILRSRVIPYSSLTLLVTDEKGNPVVLPHVEVNMLPETAPIP